MEESRNWAGTSKTHVHVYACVQPAPVVVAKDTTVGTITPWQMKI